MIILLNYYVEVVMGITVIYKAVWSPNFSFIDSRNVINVDNNYNTYLNDINF